MTIQRVFALAILVLASSGAFAEDYEIRLIRPSRVGEKCELTGSASVSEHTVTSAFGQIMDDSKTAFTAELVGTVTVLEVGERKETKKIRLVITKCTMTRVDEEEAEELLAKGTEVIGRKVEKEGEGEGEGGWEEEEEEEGEGEFLVDDEPVGPDAKKVLGLFFDFSKSEVTADDVFVTKERKKVGDSWPLNAEMAAKAAREEDVKVDPKDIEGTATVEKLVEVDGIPCLQIRCKMDLKKVVPPLPPGMKVEKSHLEAEYFGELPVDTSKRRRSMKTKIKMSLEAGGTPGPEAPEIHVVVNSEEAVQCRFKYFK